MQKHMNRRNSCLEWVLSHWAHFTVLGMVSPDGVAPSRIVGVSATVNLPLHLKVQKFSSGTGSPGWSRKKGRKTVVWRGIIIPRPKVVSFASYRTDNDRPTQTHWTGQSTWTTKMVGENPSWA